MALILCLISLSFFSLSFLHKIPEGIVVQFRNFASAPKTIRISTQTINQVLFPPGQHDMLSRVLIYRSHDIWGDNINYLICLDYARGLVLLGWTDIWLYRLIEPIPINRFRYS